MSGAAALIVATAALEEEAEDTEAAATAKQHLVPIPGSFDDELKALASDCEALAARLVEVRQKLEELV